MSNIAVPNRTEAFPAPGATARLDLARLTLGCIALCALMVTLTPFTISFEGNKDAGDLVNQLGYSTLAALALAGHMLFTDRAVALSLLRPTWLVMGGWIVLTAALAGHPENALRTATFVILAMVAATGALCLPRTARDFRLALAVMLTVVLVLSYGGLALLPDLAKHTAGEADPEQAGLWRGLYSHKNVAGAMMGAFFFYGLYLYRTGWRAFGLLVALACALFVLKTGSKTSMALLPAVAFIVLPLRTLGGRLLPAAVILCAVVAMGLLTLGTVLSPVLDSILQAILPGTTFTGRTDLWRYALELSREHQWLGFGLNSFWQTDTVYQAERDFELAWDTRNSPNGHNGYLDIAIVLGWPGLALTALMLVLLPLKDFLAIPAEPERERLADMFLMSLTYLLLNSFLESFLFERANPIWMATWISVVGLRLLARHGVARGA
ncbi:O-antigen ligase [Aurantimonas sp. Leaf443]|uniref:O-antigen ligase family protein n=1 Tax=Aurantimonas sp. Leaf443 TaxID=1736378 RepID=UPI000700DFDE|nr:O-antigen ligase [Aurantimonas sp. Leaf443]KQT87910.1 hypothetical protein ASG48_00095 [Aurantimonas sp. Leaf443]